MRFQREMLPLDVQAFSVLVMGVNMWPDVLSSFASVVFDWPLVLE